MTTAELVTDTLIDLGDDPTQPTMYYSAGEVLAALNAIQRLFVLLTLCLETTASFSLATNGTSSYQLLSTFADWLVPLRIRIASGAKLQPSTLADLAALDDSWRLTRGVPSRYCVSGFGLLSTYAQPTAPTSLSITYARCPLLLSTSQDPEIPAQYHPNLKDGAIPYLRCKEGAQEWQKVIPNWDRFMDAAQQFAGIIRARNRELGYDVLPAEIVRYDLSRMVKPKGA